MTDFLILSKPTEGAEWDKIVGVITGRKANEGEKVIREIAPQEPAVYLAVPLSKAVTLVGTLSLSLQAPDAA